MSKKNRPHFYLKIAAESGVGKKLQEFIDKCNEAEKAAREWVIKQGAAFYFESPNSFAGGVTMVEFPKTISKDGWRNIEVPDKEGYVRTDYFVPVDGSDLLKEMEALPTVNEIELINILQFKPKMVKGKDGKEVPLPFTFGDAAPALFLHQGYWYTDVPYQSESEECQEITEKEFLRRRMACTNEQK